MKQSISRKLVLAAALAFPFSAKAGEEPTQAVSLPSVTVEQARTAVAFALAAAPRNAQRISNTPVEGAFMTVLSDSNDQSEAFAKVSEFCQESYSLRTHDNGAHCRRAVGDIVATKAAFWRAVSIVLVRERTRAEMRNAETPEVGERASLQAMEMARFSLAAFLIAVDAARDAAMVESMWELEGVQKHQSQQEILNRKAELLEKICDLKKMQN